MKRFSAQICFLFPFFFFFSSLWAVHVTPGFGKTHFIVGTDSDEVLRKKHVSRLQNKLQIPDKADRIIQAFFSPDDDTRSILLNLIACEKEKICFTAYVLTDEIIVEALLEAHRRGVRIEVVADKFCCRGKYGKVKHLHLGGIEVLVYQGKSRGKMSNIMHNKFVVFHNNLLGRSIVWTGSLNFTHSARLRNQENVLLLDDEGVIQKYLQQFEILKERCVRYQYRASSEKVALKRNKLRKKNERLECSSLIKSYGIA